MTPTTTFFCGLGLLILFFGYFVTDKPEKKRLIGTLLAIAVAAFCAFFIKYTGNLPDSYSVPIERTGPAANEPIDDKLREEATKLLIKELKTEKKKDAFAINAQQSLISISRRNLDQEEVEAAVAKLEPLGLKGTVTADPKPATAIQKGIDLQGGVSFTVRIDPAVDDDGNPRPVNKESRQQAISILQKRLDPDGGKNLTPIPQGEDRIIIQLPGITAAEASKYQETIEKVAKLEFRMVKPGSDNVAVGTRPGPGWVVLPFKVDEDTKDEDQLARMGKGLIVRERPELTGKNVDRAYGQSDPREGNIISLSFDGEGTDRWAEVTKAKTGERFAVIIDGEIVIAPVIREPILNGSSQISGDFTLEEVIQIAALLENPLENPLQILESSEISATYGAETISQGVKAGIAGLIITLIFMLFYYRIAGLIALFGLLINIIILFGTLSIFQFALTMPGIAGILLTIGMAVDASVLIFERLKEERRAGKSIGAAIEAAYDKAFSAIFDANVTTLITSIILFWVASGVIKGFAVTLTIGILASLFAALIVMRVCFNWGTEKGLIKNLKFPNVVEPKKRDFLSKRKIAFVISTIFILGAIGTFVAKGKNTFGTDFRGGSVVELNLADGQNLSEEEVRNAVADVEYTNEKGDTQKVGDGVTYQLQSGASGQTVVVRGEFEAGEPIEQALKQNFEDRIKVGTNAKGEEELQLKSQRQGSLIGKDLAISSIAALVLSLAGILIYVSIRFEFSFALGAIVALFHDLVIVTGIVVLSGRELDLILVGAFLTIAGYSINDTIVVFDRIRETLRTKRGEIKDVMNLAISSTLSRTILTSVTTLVTVTTLFIFGGPSLADFSFTIIIGILVGTYSSIFVASPIVLWWSRSRKTNLRREVLDAESERMDATSPA